MTAQSIGTIRGIDDNPTLPDYLGSLLNQTLLGVFLMYLKKLTHD
jgi:hypothetical protein